MAQLVEVRWHGRGGQGAKTAGYILAVAAAEQGKKVQAFPEYGAERRGAPMRSYVRISDGPIRLRCAVRSPEVVVVLDDTLLESEDVASGVVEGGWVIVNTGATPAEAKARMGNPNVRVATVDANAIAVKYRLGPRNAPIVNTAILGAFARLTGIVSLETLCEAVRSAVPIHPEENVAAVREAYQQVAEEGR